MRIFLDNVDLSSNSGPNSFGKKLFLELKKRHTFTYDSPDVQLSFININKKISENITLRLDGVYFNTRQNWESMNESIKKSYFSSKNVIAQTNFDKKLIQEFLGKHKDIHVIHNGVDQSSIDIIEPLKNEQLNKFKNVWTCASTWRPHKRLQTNIKYFLEHKADDDCLVVAGANPDYQVDEPNIFYVGDLQWHQLISLYKRSKFFVHLAWLDHCPNVVVDARASGCHIIISSSGGTKEIAGDNCTVIQENEWNFSPIDLYSPPDIDFSKKTVNNILTSIDIKEVAMEYEKVLFK